MKIFDSTITGDADAWLNFVGRRQTILEIPGIRCYATLISLGTPAFRTIKNDPHDDLDVI
jgi:hypothetical protein